MQLLYAWEVAQVDPIPSGLGSRSEPSTFWPRSQMEKARGFAGRDIWVRAPAGPVCILAALQRRLKSIILGSRSIGIARMVSGARRRQRRTCGEGRSRCSEVRQGVAQEDRLSGYDDSFEVIQATSVKSSEVLAEFVGSRVGVSPPIWLKIGAVALLWVRDAVLSPGWLSDRSAPLGLADAEVARCRSQAISASPCSPGELIQQQSQVKRPSRNRNPRIVSDVCR